MKNMASFAVNALIAMSVYSYVSVSGYIIGRQIEATYSNFTNADTVSLSFVYGDNGENAWIVSDDLPNTGMLNFRPNLDGTIGQLVIPEGTMGEWVLSDSDGNTESLGDVTVYQPMILVPHMASEPGTHKKGTVLSFDLIIKQDVVDDLGTAVFSMSFVDIVGGMWEVVEELIPAMPTPEPTQSPIPSPTPSPTTGSPTMGPAKSPTASPQAAPTASPIPSPTASPQAAPTASPQASPTTSPVVAPTASPQASPTSSPVASPTASPQASPTTSPVASPTASPQASPTASPAASPTASPQASPTASPAASPTTSPVTATTGSPTPVVTTASPTPAGRRRRRRRLSSYLIDPLAEFNETINVTYTARIRTENITGSNMPLIVNIAARGNGLTYYNVYNNDDPVGVNSLYLPYDSDKIGIMIGDNSTMSESTIEIYEDASVSVMYDALEVTVAIVIANDNGSWSILGCDRPYDPEEYMKFGWIQTDLIGDGSSMGISPGMYDVWLFWYEEGIDLTNVNYAFNAEMPLSLTIMDAMHASPVSIEYDSNTDTEKLKRKKDIDVTVHSNSFNGSTKLGMLFQQGENIFPVDGNGDAIPGDVEVPSDLDKGNVTLWVSAMACSADRVVLTPVTRGRVTGGSSSGSNSLSAGAIVGIVCAGVLICGLAAWWICMRKGQQKDGYGALDE